MEKSRVTAADIRRAMATLDNKYYSEITQLVSSYIEEYLSMMHPEMSADRVDNMINLCANAWYHELTCDFLALEHLPENSFDS